MLVRLWNYEVSYIFEWDPDKAAENLRSHKVSFEDATTAFGDPLALHMPDPDHSLLEERFLLLGLSHQLRLLVVSYMERGLRTRIISARKATRHERSEYEEE